MVRVQGGEANLQAPAVHPIRAGLAPRERLGPRGRHALGRWGKARASGSGWGAPKAPHWCLLARCQKAPQAGGMQRERAAGSLAKIGVCNTNAHLAVGVKRPFCLSGLARTKPPKRSVSNHPAEICIATIDSRYLQTRAKIFATFSQVSPAACLRESPWTMENANARLEKIQNFVGTARRAEACDQASP